MKCFAYYRDDGDDGAGAQATSRTAPRHDLIEFESEDDMHRWASRVLPESRRKNPKIVMYWSEDEVIKGTGGIVNA